MKIIFLPFGTSNSFGSLMNGTRNNKWSEITDVTHRIALRSLVSFFLFPFLSLLRATRRHSFPGLAYFASRCNDSPVFIIRTQVRVCFHLRLHIRLRARYHLAFCDIAALASAMTYAPGAFFDFLIPIRFASRLRTFLHLRRQASSRWISSSKTYLPPGRRPKEIIYMNIRHVLIIQNAFSHISSHLT